MHRITAVLIGSLVSIAALPQAVSAQEQAGTPTAAAERQVLAAERVIWESIKNQQWSVFDKSIAGMTYVQPSGIVVWKPGNPKQFEGLVTHSYSLDSVQTRTLAPGTVLLTYKANVDQTWKGQHEPSTVYMLSVWQFKSGKWVPVAHSETPAEKPEKGSASPNKQ